jgi:hypothetical protein
VKFSDTFCRAAIATGAIVPPPGPVSRPLEHILAWLAAGAVLVILGLLGVLYGSWRV